MRGVQLVFSFEPFWLNFVLYLHQKIENTRIAYTFIKAVTISMVMLQLYYMLWNIFTIFVSVGDS